MTEEYVWKDVGVVGFDELMQALERADRKGYMPDAVKEAWEAFNWKPNWKPAQRTWVGLTDEDIDIAFDDTQEGGGFNEFARAIEAKLKEKNT